MFKPKLNVVHVDNTIRVADQTGFYDPSDNPGGWGTPNPERMDVTEGLIRIEFNGHHFDVVNVTETVVQETDEYFQLHEFIGQKEVNGVYTLYYILSAGGEMYTSIPFYFFDLSKVYYWNSQFWARLARMYDSYKFREMAKECVWLNTMISGLEALADDNNVMGFLSLLKVVERRIEINKPYLSTT